MKESSSEKLLSIAAIQFAPDRAAIQNNLDTITAMLGQTSAECVVLPELASTGYFYTDPRELGALAEEPDSGRLCSVIRTDAVENRRVTVAGFAEKQGEKLYNSAILAFPDGSYSVYRKTHLFYRESDVFRPGDTGFFVREWNGVRYGMMICYDWRFPESCRSLALKGADVILHPSNLVAPASLWRPTMQTRAFENRVVTVTANRIGTEIVGDESLAFSGESQIVDCSGTMVGSGSPAEQEIVEAVVYPARCRKKSFSPYNDIIRDRRPEMYVNE